LLQKEICHPWGILARRGRTFTTSTNIHTKHKHARRARPSCYLHTKHDHPQQARTPPPRPKNLPSSTTSETPRPSIDPYERLPSNAESSTRSEPRPHPAHSTEGTMPEQSTSKPVSASLPPSLPPVMDPACRPCSATPGPHKHGHGLSGEGGRRAGPASARKSAACVELGPGRGAFKSRVVDGADVPWKTWRRGSRGDGELRCCWGSSATGIYMCMLHDRVGEAARVGRMVGAVGGCACGFYGGGWWRACARRWRAVSVGCHVVVGGDGVCLLGWSVSRRAMSVG
jgi:hypothetical protein